MLEILLTKSDINVNSSAIKLIRHLHEIELVCTTFPSNFLLLSIRVTLVH